MRGDAAQAAENFARALRTLVQRAQQLGVSQNRLGARIHVTSGSMSKYLVGDRVPDWSVVESLLREVEKITSQSVDTTTRQQLHELQKRALFLRHPQRHEVQRISAELEASEQQLADLKAREAVLEQQVEDLRQDLADLADQRVREREQHQAEQEKLRRELDDTAARIAQKQKQCAELEEQLAQAEERAATAEQTGSAEPLVPLEMHDEREFGPDHVAMLEVLVDAYRQARTGEEINQVFGKLRELPWYAGAAALALFDSRYPEVDPSSFASAAVAGRPLPHLLDAIAWFYRHLSTVVAERLTQLVTLGIWVQTLPDLLRSLAQARQSLQLSAVTTAACNNRTDFSAVLNFCPHTLDSLLASHVSDSTLFREIHRREQEFRSVERKLRDPSREVNRKQLNRVLLLLMSGNPSTTASRILWLSPQLQEMALSHAAGSEMPSAASLARLAKIAAELRRHYVRQETSERDLASLLLWYAVYSIKDPVRLADLLSMWEEASEPEGGKLVLGDRSLVLSGVLKRLTPDAVGHLLTHNVALPPGSTDFAWRLDKLQLWQAAVNDLPYRQRRSLAAVMRSLTRSASAGRKPVG